MSEPNCSNEIIGSFAIVIKWQTLLDMSSFLQLCLRQRKIITVAKSGTTASHLMGGKTTKSRDLSSVRTFFLLLVSMGYLVSTTDKKSASRNPSSIIRIYKHPTRIPTLCGRHRLYEPSSPCWWLTDSNVLAGFT